MSKKETEILIFQKVTDANLYDKLIDQLNRDFVFAGLSTNFSSQILPKEIIMYLSKILIALVANNFSDYLNLLYRIDIPEIEIKKLDGSNIDKMCKQVAILILQRECQKVWLRSRF